MYKLTLGIPQRTATRINKEEMERVYLATKNKMNEAKKEEYCPCASSHYDTIFIFVLAAAPRIAFAVFASP